MIGFLDPIADKALIERIVGKPMFEGDKACACLRVSALPEVRAWLMPRLIVAFMALHFGWELPA